MCFFKYLHLRRSFFFAPPDRPKSGSYLSQIWLCSRLARIRSRVTQIPQLIFVATSTSSFSMDISIVLSLRCLQPSDRLNELLGFGVRQTWRTVFLSPTFQLRHFVNISKLVSATHCHYNCHVKIITRTRQISHPQFTLNITHTEKIAFHHAEFY